jgi:hypothetical protein
LPAYNFDNENYGKQNFAGCGVAAVGIKGDPNGFNRRNHGQSKKDYR